MSDPDTTRPQGTINPNQPKKSWLAPIAGAVCFFLVFGGLAWWFNVHRGEAPTAPVAEATSPVEDNDAVTVTAVEVEPEPVAEPTSEPVVVSEPEATPEPTPRTREVVPARPAVVSIPTQPTPATMADPTSCTFINGSRPQVGDKYVLTCSEGSFLATGEYKGGGVFLFSDFAPHNLSK